MMKSNVSNAASLILLLMAASSLLSMIGLTQIDRIVHRDLYRFSLQFSYEWAMPYWTMTAIVFGMGWFNIIVAIAFQLYILISRRREAEVSMIRAEATRFETPSIPISVESKQPEEAPTPSVEIEQKPEEKEEEPPQPVEETAPTEPSEAKPPEEEQEESEGEPQEGVELKPEETPTPPVETQPETQEKSEETPILVGEPEVEI